MLTKTGKTRLGPLNVAQLETMLEKSSKAKDKIKIERALTARRKTQAVSTKVVVEAVAEVV
jgi:hypothetical protein